MPAGKAQAPGGVPFHLSFRTLRGKLPKGKIRGIAFFRVAFDPSAFLKRFKILMGQLGVILKLGIALFFQGLDEGNLLGYRISSLYPDVRRQNIEMFNVLFK